MSPGKYSMGALTQDFLEFLEKAVKLKIFLVLLNSTSNVKTKLTNDKNQTFLSKNDPKATRNYD